MHRLTIATSLAGLALAAAPAGAAAATSLWLDTHDVSKKTSTKVLGPVKTKRALALGKPYVAKVKGTWSYYDAKEYKTCGKPEKRPTYKSKGKGVKNGKVGNDAEFIFADRRDNCKERGTTLAPGIQLRIAVGSKYLRIIPLGNPTKPTKGHTYSYPLVGSGKRAGFELLDRRAKDNYGRLRITVRAAKASDCAGMGFAAFGGFVDETSCVAATQLPG